jgi:predicted amidophosphoribosyltransferase
MVKNTYEATVECIERLHRVVCLECPNMPEKFKQKWCPTCTRTLKYEDVLEEISKEPWFEA